MRLRFPEQPLGMTQHQPEDARPHCNAEFHYAAGCVAVDESLLWALGVGDTT